MPDIAGSIPLKRDIDEVFCQNYIAEGLDFDKAYRTTYEKFMPEKLAAMSEREIKRKTGDVQRRKGVKDRISFLIKERSNVSAARITDEYEEIAMSNIADFVEWTDGSVSLKDSESIDREKARAIKSVKMTQHGVSIEMHDKMGALDRLSRRFSQFSKTEALDVSDDAEEPTLVLFDTSDTKQIEAVDEMKRRADSLEPLAPSDEDAEDSEEA